jgi:hypothetical protein
LGRRRKTRVPTTHALRALASVLGEWESRWRLSLRGSHGREQQTEDSQLRVEDRDFQSGTFYAG